MRVKFLLGPAGSGKTHRCLEEIRDELIARPEGPPLLFLAPKQATFQIERQLLGDGSLPGYSRLQILSFERLAEIVLVELAGRRSALLSEEGRVMVLRSLLAREQGNLRIFHATARLPGFARQLSLVLRELQQHQLGPGRLGKLSQCAGLPGQLRGKLGDLARLLEAYQEWLEDRQLLDANRLLDLAAAALRRGRDESGETVYFGGLWMDGFAEMTPQELDLLAALIPRCARTTLAFCLEAFPETEAPWLSTWAVVSRTCRECHLRLSAATGERPALDRLPRQTGQGRFADCLELAHLERHWTSVNPPPLLREDSAGAGAIRFVACPSPAVEAEFAAREILRHVRVGGRYREVAVLVRQLTTHSAVLRRVFSRYEIPFFIDQRESVAHHPLAELTRHALRTVAFNWRMEDWFGALKSGLAHDNDAHLDELENAALSQGWEGAAWQSAFGFEAADRQMQFLERLRGRLVGPFLGFREALRAGSEEAALTPTGSQLARAFRALWDELRVGETLQGWSEQTQLDAATPILEVGAAAHATVWQQMHDWLDNLELAFGDQAMPLRDWLPVLEAGLGQLTIGVIPPALDQVMIGAVDRSRNPDLEVTLLLGMNEKWFPAPPPPPGVLGEDERMALENERVFLGSNHRLRLGHERYYGYIACTRPRRQLILSWSETDDEGRLLNPSPFVEHLRRMFPEQRIENFGGLPDWPQAEHASEVISFLMQPDHPLAPWLPELSRQLAGLRDYRPSDALAPAVAERLYGQTLPTSVSAIEQFGMCPFRFCISAGLGAEEREYFEVDPLSLGSFQHNVLARFHQELQAAGKKWRDLTPVEARERIGRLAAVEAQDFNSGLFEATAENRFTRDVLSGALQDFVETIVGWMSTYQFDPVAVEVAFGTQERTLPAWNLELEEGHCLAFRGRIDRIDVCGGIEPGEALCVVMDYKSSARTLDPVLLEYGIQMQLPAYLAVLRHVPEARALLGGKQVVPAGMFYVNLRGSYPPTASRSEALTDPAAARRKAYQHAGRFDLAVLPKLDRGQPQNSGQFKYRLTKDNQPYASDTDPMRSEKFLALLDKVERNLQRMGREIYQGVARVDPYQKRSELACDDCRFKAICRIDFWTHPFRRLPGKIEP